MMRHGVIAGLGLGLSLAGCGDPAREAAVTKRCETLLAAQELAALSPVLRADPRARIVAKDSPRISAGDRSMFVRRSYDRLIDRDGKPVIEPRDYSCTFDTTIDTVVTLTTNGHQQEFRLNDAEWAVAVKSAVAKVE